MGKIVVGEFISLDGVVEAPDTWHFPYVNDEMFAVMWGLADRCPTMLLGRNTYLSFASGFAHAPADDPVAAQMNKPTKVVVSATLGDDLEWANSVRLHGDVAAEVRALKERSDADILVTGSTMLVRTLLRAGLVDELNLLVHPIVLGHGQRLFEEEGERLPLTLVSSSVFTTGVVHQAYTAA
jgi:dihydrofolate reductase